MSRAAAAADSPPPLRTAEAALACSGAPCRRDEAAGGLGAPRDRARRRRPPPPDPSTASRCRASRCRCSCSATRRPSATHGVGQRHPARHDRRRAVPHRRPAGTDHQPGQGGRADVRARRADQRGPAGGPGGRRHRDRTNDVTHTVLPSESVRLLDAAVRRLRPRAARSSWAPAPTWAPSSRCRTRCGWSPGSGAAGSPRRRTIASSRPVGLGLARHPARPELTAAPGERSGPTSSTRRQRATRHGGRPAALAGRRGGVRDDDEDLQMPTATPCCRSRSGRRGRTPARHRGRPCRGRRPRPGPARAVARIRHRVRRPRLPGPAAPMQP